MLIHSLLGEYDSQKPFIWFEERCEDRSYIHLYERANPANGLLLSGTFFWHQKQRQMVVNWIEKHSKETANAIG